MTKPLKKFLSQYVDVGCDPEVFVIDKDTGKPVSPHKLSKGTKQAVEQMTLNLLPITKIGHSISGGLQVDGLALEFNISPAKGAELFSASVKTMLDVMKKRLPENLDLGFMPTTFFDPAALKDVPEANLELGCDPDFDAYTLEPNTRPSPPKDSRGVMRTAAGHIHIGFNPHLSKPTAIQNGFDPDSSEFLEDCVRLVRNMDQVFIGVEKLWDKDTERRKMYGKPGCFRPKWYGVEYRSLSNAWLAHPELYEWIYNTTWYVATATKEGYDLSSAFKSRTFSSREEYNTFAAGSPVLTGYQYKKDTHYKDNYHGQCHGSRLPELPVIKG